MRFTNSIQPPYLRRTKSLDELIPWLFLKGVSSADFFWRFRLSCG